MRSTSKPLRVICAVLLLASFGLVRYPAAAQAPQPAEAYFQQGKALAEKGQLDDAIAAFQRALQLKPNYPEALKDLGNVLLRKDQLDDALASYRKALEQQPNYAEAIHNIGLVLAEKNQLDEAITHYQKALALKPDLHIAHHNLSRAWAKKGDALAAKGEHDEAISVYRKAIELRPDYVEALNNLGVALQMKGRLDEATAAYLRALELKPDADSIENNIVSAGYALQRKGRVDDAIAAYQRALILKSDSVLIKQYLELAQQEKQGREKKAATALVQSTFEDPKGRFALDLPEGWDLLPGSDAGTYLFSVPWGEIWIQVFEITVTDPRVSKQKLDEKEMVYLLHWYAGESARLRDLPYFYQVRKPVVFKLNGRHAHWYMFETKVALSRGRTGLLAFKGDALLPNGGVVFTGILTERDREDWQKAVEKVFRSIRAPRHHASAQQEKQAGEKKTEAVSGSTTPRATPQTKTPTTSAGVAQSTFAVELRGHTDDVTAIAFSPDGRWLASGSADTIKLWAPATGQEVRTLMKPHERKTEPRTPEERLGHATDIFVRAVHKALPSPVIFAFSPDGRRLAAAGVGAGARQIKLWEVATGQEIRTRVEVLASAGYKPLGFSPDGRWVATKTEYGWVLLWPMSGEGQRNFRGLDKGVTAVAFSPDSLWLAAGGADGAIRLWEVATQKAVLRLAGSEGAVEALAFSPDRRWLAAAGRKSVKLWEVATGSEARILAGDELISEIAFSSDGHWLVAASGKNVKLWEVATGREGRTLTGEDRIHRVAFSPDGRWLAAASGKSVKLWRVGDLGLSSRP